MAVVETEILNLSALKPLVWKRYSDDMFLMWNVQKQLVMQFIQQANKHHRTIMIVGPLALNSWDKANGNHIIFNIVLPLPIICGTKHKFLVLIRVRLNKKLNEKREADVGGRTSWHSEVQQTNQFC